MRMERKRTYVLMVDQIEFFHMEMHNYIQYWSELSGFKSVIEQKVPFSRAVSASNIGMK